MNPNRFQQCFLIFAVGTLLACIASGRWLLNGEMNVFNALSSFNTLQFQTSGLFSVPNGIASFFSGVATMFSWNYPFLSSPWAFPVKFLLWVISAGAIVALVQEGKGIIQGAISLFRP